MFVNVVNVNVCRLSAPLIGRRSDRIFDGGRFVIGLCRVWPSEPKQNASGSHNSYRRGIDLYVHAIRAQKTFGHGRPRSEQMRNAHCSHNAHSMDIKTCPTCLSRFHIDDCGDSLYQSSNKLLIYCNQI